MGRIMCAKSRCGPISEYVASDDAHGLAGAFTASVNLGASTLAGYCSAFATISLSSQPVSPSHIPATHHPAMGKSQSKLSPEQLADLQKHTYCACVPSPKAVTLHSQDMLPSSR